MVIGDEIPTWHNLEPYGDEPWKAGDPEPEQRYQILHFNEKIQKWVTQESCSNATSAIDRVRYFVRTVNTTRFRVLDTTDNVIDFDWVPEDYLMTSCADDYDILHKFRVERKVTILSLGDDDKEFSYWHMRSGYMERAKAVAQLKHNAINFSNLEFRLRDAFLNLKWYAPKVEAIRPTLRLGKERIQAF